MALIVRGKTTCGLCDKVIQDGDEVVAFSPFVANERDPLFRYSDGAFHAACFWREADAKSAMERWEEVRERNAPERRICAVCGQRITDPDDYLGFGFVAESTEPVSLFNHLHLHRSHLSAWADLDRAAELLQQFQSAGKWAGQGLDWLLAQLREGQSAREK